MTMWSLTLPQVAATLAATLVAFDTRNPPANAWSITVCSKWSYSTILLRTSKEFSDQSASKAIYIEPFKPGAFRS
jgi:hypothetical protein